MRTGRPRNPIASGVHPLVRQLLTDHRAVETNLTELLGYGRSTVAKWRNGANGPTLAAFTDVANALGFELVLVRNPALTRPGYNGIVSGEPSHERQD